jgi:hypothetical protein
MKRRFGMRKVTGILCMVVVGVLVVGSIVMLLWNALMPVIFHLPLISFWQALGLLILTKILFSGFRGGGPGFRNKRDNLRQAWMNMNPEQREKFKQKWDQRCGGSFRGQRPWDDEPSASQPATTTEKPA